MESFHTGIQLIDKMTEDIFLVLGEFHFHNRAWWGHFYSDIAKK